MNKVDFFKQQSKNFLKDYNSKVFNEYEEVYEYAPRFFSDISDIVYGFDINEDDKFTLMNAQHIIAKLAGFYKWTELIKASDAALELGKLLLENRIKYQEKMGIFIEGESLIVEDWKNYENENLQGFDDESKLDVFKLVFLENIMSDNKKRESILINFTNYEASQDMIKMIMKEKNKTADKAILSSITKNNFVKIIDTPWIDIALGHWGHDNYDRKFETLDNPIVEFKLTKEKERLINIIMENKNVSFNLAIMYFVIMELDSLGYHL